MVKVMDGAEVSDIYGIENVVKQGCLLGPTLFSMLIRTMMEEVFRMQISLKLHTSERSPPCKLLLANESVLIAQST